MQHLLLLISTEELFRAIKKRRTVDGLACILLLDSRSLHVKKSQRGINLENKKCLSQAEGKLQNIRNKQFKQYKEFVQCSKYCTVKCAAVSPFSKTIKF